ncbi:MAG: DUF4173 domain-containing protein [Cardiobacteriaceae bacterium]|nr:DUF4173 domain-containing protein [Cardiobacteriaceae bacterium]
MPSKSPAASLPHPSLYAALFIGLMWGLIAYNFPTKTTLFFLLNGGMALMLNWPLLCVEEKTVRTASLSTFLIVLTTLAYNIMCGEYQDFTGNEGYDRERFYIAVILSLVSQGGTLLISCYCTQQKGISPDHNLSRNLHRLTRTILLYGLFAGLTAIILSAGFALLNLVDINIVYILGYPGMSILIGLCAGASLYPLHRISLSAPARALPSLSFFQYLAIFFAWFYLLVLPFTHTDSDSGQRLIIAAILWLLAIALHDNKEPRILCNSLCALTGLILVIISLRGITIRIHAYGLTEPRCYIVSLCIALLLAHAGLLAKMICLQRKIVWGQRLHTITITILIAYAAILALLPLPHFVLHSQLAHLSRPDFDLKTLDHSNELFFFDYGTAGKDTLAAIYRAHGSEYTPKSIEETEDGSNETINPEQARKDFFAVLQRYPTDFDIPDDFADHLISTYCQQGRINCRKSERCLHF